MTQAYIVAMNTHWFVIIILSTIHLEFYLTLNGFLVLQSNSKFALSVEPTNEVLQSYAAYVAELRGKKLPTVNLSFLVSVTSLSLKSLAK